jgi:hypothetical protein
MEMSVQLFTLAGLPREKKKISASHLNDTRQFSSKFTLSSVGSVKQIDWCCLGTKGGVQGSGGET